MIIAIFISRDRSSTERLGVRMALFSVGAMLALAGMTMGQNWMVWVAAVVLVVAFGLRFGTSEEVDEELDEG